MPQQHATNFRHINFTATRGFQLFQPRYPFWEPPILVSIRNALVDPMPTIFPFILFLYFLFLAISSTYLSVYGMWYDPTLANVQGIGSTIQEH